MEGPWVFGLVIQDQNILEKNKSIIAANKIKRKYAIREAFPKDKSIRRKCYKDGRKVNLKNQRIYGFKNGKATRNYKSIYSKIDSSNIQEISMFIVQRRDAITLMPLIKQHVSPLTEIHSDEWRAYRRISKEGFKHYTVNHTENFVDSSTGAHTQLIECLWNVAKFEIDKRARGKSEHLLHGYLAQKWFFSVTGKDQQKRFEEICSVLKQHSYTEIREMTSKQL